MRPLLLLLAAAASAAGPAAAPRLLRIVSPEHGSFVQLDPAGALPGRVEAALAPGEQLCVSTYAGEWHCQGSAPLEFDAVVVSGTMETRAEVRGADGGVLAAAASLADVVHPRHIDPAAAWPPATVYWPHPAPPAAGARLPRLAILGFTLSVGGQELLYAQQAERLPGSAYVAEAGAGDGPLLAELAARGARVLRARIPPQHDPFYDDERSLAALAGAARWPEVPAAPRLALQPLYDLLLAFEAVTVANSWNGQTLAALHVARLAGVPIRVLELPNPAPAAALGAATTAVVAPSHHAAADAQARALGAPITVIPPIGVEPPAAAAARRPAGWTVRVGCVQRLTQRKGLGLVLRALAELARGAVELHVYGDGPQRGALEARARELGVAATFHGAVAPADVPAALATLDVFVSGCVQEVFGAAIVDAMAQGLPVVAFHSSAHAEIVEHGVTGLLARLPEAREMAEAVGRLAGSASLRAEMGLAGRRRALTEFSAEAFTARYAALYARLAEEAYPWGDEASRRWTQREGYRS